VNLDPIRHWLEDHLGVTVNAAFIYGSVAAGRNRPGSDLDCFVLTEQGLVGAERRRIKAGFATLQRELGFTPDPVYPVELFSIEACRTILSDPALGRILTKTAMDDIEPDVAQSDQVEVLRALLDRRLVVRHSTCLDVLSEQARSLVRRTAPNQAVWRRAFGLNQSEVGT
jgi:Polymerase beta, Nucleotidyltransferase